MKEKKERGAMVVEATISLTAYIFVIFTILSIVDICYIQSKMAVSLNAAAKELSQYSYLYFKFGLDEFQQELHDGTKGARTTADATVDGVGALIESATGMKENLESGDFENLIEDAKSGGKTVKSLVGKYEQELSNPRGFLIGMGKMALEELGEETKSLLVKVMAEFLMRKNLSDKKQTYSQDTADAFLKRWGIEKGMAGLDFNYSAMMPYGKSDIILVVTYDVKVLQLLNIDYSFTFRQCARTKAWGNGVSKLKPEQNVTDKKESIWDEKNMALRGEKLVEAEKKRFTYTSSGAGFDAYNNVGGANEFVTIVSCDTSMNSYLTADGIKNKLSSAWGGTKGLYSAVAEVGEEFTATDASGNTVTLSSLKETRTYKIVLVVPDNADKAMLQEVKQKFEQEKASLGDTVVVEIRTGYGEAKEEAETEKEDED